MALIQVNHLTFSYDGSYDEIFEDVSFQIDTNWKLGFIGRNGRGKTTFLRLLMGWESYRGEISSPVNFEYFPYSMGQEEETAIDRAENLLGDCEYWKLRRELHLLELDEEILYRPLGTLSQGERTKLMLAIMFLKEDPFLLIDEPTNHLDEKGRKQVSNYLNRKKGFLLVSHDREFLDGCIDHVLSLNRRTITVEKGNFSSWQENARMRQAYEEGEHNRLKKEIHKLEEASGRTARWSDKVEKTKNGTRKSGVKADKGHIGAQAARLMKRAKATEARQKRAIEEKSQLLQDREKTEKLKISPLRHPSEMLISGEQICLYYDGRKVTGPVNFQIRRDTRTVIRGVNGAGKSSLLKLLAGEDISFTGTLRRASGLILSVIPQGTAHLRGTLTALAAREGIDETLLKTILRKLDFERIQFEKPMETFSEGQKKKVLVAASLCRKAHLYIWDEPLNYIDVLSRLQLEELIKEYRPALVFVEHDVGFCREIAEETIVLGAGNDAFT